MSLSVFNKVRVAAAGAAMSVVMSAGAALADQVADAKALVTSYYTNMLAEKYAPMLPMFAPDAEVIYTTKWGYGMPDSVVNLSDGSFDIADLQKYAEAEIPEKYKSYFEGYKELGREFTIVDAKQTGETVTVTGRATQDYEIKGYKGKNIQSDTFVIKFVADKPLIAKYDAVATFE